MDVAEWLKWCIGGVILGIFPLWWWCSEMILEATLNKNKKVPSLLIFLVKNGPGPGIFHELLYRKSYYLLLFRGLTIIGLIGASIFIQYYAWYNYVNHDFDYFLNLETGFFLFFLLTALVPSYFLKRYLTKLS
jgi:hypothetical protein